MKLYEVSGYEKKVIVEQNSIGYSTNFFIDDKIYNKTTVQSLNEAITIADEFVDRQEPKFLSETDSGS